MTISWDAIYGHKSYQWIGYTKNLLAGLDIVQDVHNFKGLEHLHSKGKSRLTVEVDDDDIHYVVFEWDEEFKHMKEGGEWRRMWEWWWWYNCRHDMFNKKRI